MAAAPKPIPKAKSPRRRLRNRGGRYGADWPEIRDRLLAKAGYRCRIPGCGRKTKDVHHIIPFSVCRVHQDWLLIVMCRGHHTYYDARPGDRWFLFDIVGTPVSLRQWRYERSARAV